MEFTLVGRSRRTGLTHVGQCRIDSGGVIAILVKDRLLTKFSSQGLDDPEDQNEVADRSAAEEDDFHQSDVRLGVDPGFTSTPRPTLNANSLGCGSFHPASATDG